MVLRTSIISFTVAFALVGAFQFLNRKKISLITSGEAFQINSTDGKTLQINLNDILYVSSDDKYVDIHYLKNVEREKFILRSSLKNIEDQVVNPISPLIRCHRRFLININHFQIIKSVSRRLTLRLKNQEDQIPVSNQYVKAIRNLLIHETV